MTIKKYHTKKNGELGICIAANKESCPNGGVHVFAGSPAEAKYKYEEKIKDHYPSFPTNLSQGTNQALNNKVLDFKRDSDRDYEELIELGGLIVKKSNSRLSFDPDSIKQKDFNEKLLNEISANNKGILSEIVPTGGNFEKIMARRNDPNSVSLFLEAVKFLPDSLKKKVAKEVIIIKPGEEKGVHGSYKQSTKSLNIFNRNSKIAEVEFVLPFLVEGDDSFDVRSKYGTVIHEYAHYVHDLDKKRTPPGTFRLTNPSSLYVVLDGKSDQGILQKVFNQYGDPEENRREGLLGYSTEELFYPGAIAASKKSSNPVLYGSDRAKEADDILHFTMGYWVQQAIVADKE